MGFGDRFGRVDPVVPFEVVDDLCLIAILQRVIQNIVDMHLLLMAHQIDLVGRRLAAGFFHHGFQRFHFLHRDLGLPGDLTGQHDRFAGDYC